MFLWCVHLPQEQKEEIFSFLSVCCIEIVQYKFKPNDEIIMVNCDHKHSNYFIRYL